MSTEIPDVLLNWESRDEDMGVLDECVNDWIQDQNAEDYIDAAEVGVKLWNAMSGENVEEYDLLHIIISNVSWLAWEAAITRIAKRTGIPNDELSDIAFAFNDEEISLSFTVVPNDNTLG